MSSNGLRLGIALILPFCVAISCANIAGLDGDRTLGSTSSSSVSSTSSAGGGGGGQGGSGGEGGQACVSVTYPDPPTSGMTGGEIEFTAALRSIDIGDGPNKAELGLDLDGRCTCLGDGPSCLEPANALDTCDGPGGRDNATGKLFSFFAALIGQGFGSEEFSQDAEVGNFSLLFRVRGYNGMPDDDQVELAMFPSVGIDPGPPLWDGNDLWPIPETAVLPMGTLEEPAYVDLKAYVTGNVIVASLPDAGIVLGSGANDITLDITAGLMVGTIVSVGSSYGIRDGLLAGRWKTQDVFNTISKFRDGSDKPICSGQLLYDSLKAQICGNADIYSGLGKPTDPCDALSIALGFTADPGKLGPLVTGDPLSPGCDPQDDPANDSCDM